VATFTLAPCSVFLHDLPLTQWPCTLRKQGHVALACLKLIFSGGRLVSFLYKLTVINPGFITAAEESVMHLASEKAGQ
jgi:hypothetical protein